MFNDGAPSNAGSSLTGIGIGFMMSINRRSNRIGKLRQIMPEFRRIIPQQPQLPGNLPR
ncbi:hypothetical protein [Acidiphilium acidophilum]|uniref:hypothetical protein n=1 Tax=Acidiphilium acidophilum TaxID=76588 RepID=UPI002E8E755C|nr:hypothetical protein [Acidiphilium acidophilum]